MEDGQQRIVVAVGLPGSGKSTYFRNLGVPTLSSDALRLLLADDENDQSIHHEVFLTLRYLLRRRIRIGRPVTYMDATHLSPAERIPYLKIGARHRCRVEAIFFDVPLEVCKQRNRSRERFVPEDVVDMMASRMAPPTLEEGFAAVHVVRP